LEYKSTVIKITPARKFYMYLSRGIFLKKGSPRTPLQRLLSQKQAHRVNPYGLVFKFKVLGKEVEEKPFSKGFSSICTQKLCIGIIFITVLYHINGIIRHFTFFLYSA